MERAILTAVARADLILCQIAALPWNRIGLSLLISAIACGIIKREVKR